MLDLKTGHTDGDVSTCKQERKKAINTLRHVHPSKVLDSFLILQLHKISTIYLTLS